MARYVMVLRRWQDSLRGALEGGWALKIKTFLGPVMATSEASAVWAQKSRELQANSCTKSYQCTCFFVWSLYLIVLRWANPLLGALEGLGPGPS
jgi:hypothetical protein